jgi:hypothetical protein
VHEYVTAALDRVNNFPMVGTAEWCALADNDPAKLAAVFDAAQHWALRVETAQHEAEQLDAWLADQSRLYAECDASQAISAAADWSAIAQWIRDRDEFYTKYPYLKRVAS